MSKLTWGYAVVFGMVTVAWWPVGARAADAPAASQPATSQPTATLEAKQTEELTAAKDKVVTVKGTVSRAGWSPRGNILFINFEGVPREGFSAVVPKDN